MKLTEDEWAALRRATGHLSSACEDFRCETCEANFSAVEAILIAREQRTHDGEAI